MHYNVLIYYTQAVLSGAVRVVNSIERDTSVLVHCSDGWDRTAQANSESAKCED